MSVRTVHQSPGTADLANFGSHAGVKVDTNDNALKFKDASGSVRSMVHNAQADPFAGVDGAMRYIEVAISSAEIKALRATPKTLVPAPGAGKANIFHGMALLLDATATGYTETADNLAVKYEDGSGDAVSDTIETTGFIDQTTDQLTVAVPIKDPIVAKAIAENKPLVLHNTGDGEIATGTGVLRAKVWYSVITTGW